MLKMDILFSNIIAWIVGVIFAFVTNKFLVFESKSKESTLIFKELFSFTTSRLFTLAVEELILFIFVKKIGLNSLIIKLTAQVLVVILNYILSKIFVFKKELK